MLVLSRRISESIVIDGRIVITVLRCDGEIVKIGIDAPPDVPVHRQEIYDEIQANNRAALIQGEQNPLALKGVRALAGAAVSDNQANHSLHYGH